MAHVSYFVALALFGVLFAGLHNVVAHQKRQIYGMVFFAAPETPKPIILYPISYLEGDHLTSRTNLFLNLFNLV